jgi:hypothetical protein
MSAVDNIQLKLFERAGVLAASPSVEINNPAFKDRFVAQKLEQSRTEMPTGRGKTAPPGVNTTYESIKQYGVKHPVAVKQTGEGSYILQHGHHRVYSANDINPDMWVPLTHDGGSHGNEEGDWEDPTIPYDDTWAAHHEYWNSVLKK